MRFRLAVLVAAVALVAAACGSPYLAPPGEAPVRYRDLVFGDVTTTAGVSYGSATNQQGQLLDLKLDVYEPTGDTVTARPAIVWVHGGGFSGGNRTSPEIVDQATVFARKGYRFKGVATILESGPRYVEAIRFFESRGSIVRLIREVVLIRIQSAQPLDSPAYDLGMTEDDVRARWERHFDTLRAARRS